MSSAKNLVTYYKDSVFRVKHSSEIKQMLIGGYEHAGFNQLSITLKVPSPQALNLLKMKKSINKINEYAAISI